MAKQQLHKRQSNEQVKFILKKYLFKEIRAKDAMEKLGVGRTRFYQLVHEYEDNPTDFTVDYERIQPTKVIAPEIEKNILKELEFEKTKIIENPKVPTKRYNYSYIKDLLDKKYKQKVSIPTIIKRAKSHGYYLKKIPKKIHDREILTDYVGELIQHDSSHHLFAPDGDVKWYLITSLDDYSRRLLYADLWLKETSFAHILSLQDVILKYGTPYAYYTDQHRIFRYVKDRDKSTPCVNYSKFTDDVDPQWKQVIKELKIEPIYALSPQAKGKIERPYGWLQDHLIRTLVRENITDINEARKILKREVYQYNNKKVHSTTKEVPIIRFNRAIKEEKSMFREFKLESPYQSVKDIFCLKETRKVDAYRRISFQNNTFDLPQIIPGKKVELRIYPGKNTTEIRFWNKDTNTFISSKRVKSSGLSTVHF